MIKKKSKTRMETNPLLAGCLGVLMLCPLWTMGAELQTETLTLRFDPAAGYALHEVTHRGHNLNFLAPSPADARTQRALWTLYIRDQQGGVRELTPADAQTAGHVQQDNALVLQWRGVSHTELGGSLDVTVHVSVAPDGVRPDEAGRIWQLRIEPGYQASIWLAGDAFEYLSTSPDQVVAPFRRAEQEELRHQDPGHCRTMARPKDSLFKK